MSFNAKTCLKSLQTITISIITLKMEFCTPFGPFLSKNIQNMTNFLDFLDFSLQLLCLYRVGLERAGTVVAWDPREQFKHLYAQLTVVTSCFR